MSAAFDDKDIRTQKPKYLHLLEILCGGKFGILLRGLNSKHQGDGSVKDREGKLSHKEIKTNNREPWISAKLMRKFCSITVDGSASVVY